MSGKISGQLFLRKQATAEDGRDLFMVVGIVAFPKGADVKDCHQYAVLGNYVGDALNFFMPDGFEIEPELPTGSTANNILTAPIWRV